jgi:hypothetical protein
MKMYVSNGTFGITWIDVGGTPCYMFDPEHLHSFMKIKSIFTISFEQYLLTVYFWEQSTIPSLCNLIWTEAARDTEGLDIHDQEFGQYCSRYLAAQS